MMMIFEVPEYLAACRALGPVNKVVIGPLWRYFQFEIL